MTRAVSFLLALVLAVGAVGCGEHGSSRAAPPGVGEPAPEWEAVALDGDTRNLEDLRGQVVVLNVWATWCGPCVREMPGLEALHRRYAGEGLRVLGASVDRAAAEGEVRRFVDRHEITFTVLLDPDQTVADRFWTLGVPETFLIDRSGTLAHRWIGEFDPMAPAVRDRVETLLRTEH